MIKATDRIIWYELLSVTKITETHKVFIKSSPGNILIAEFIFPLDLTYSFPMLLFLPPENIRIF